MSRRKEIEGTKANKSYTFILPMCKINHRYLPSNFINSYISNDNKLILIFEKIDFEDLDFNKFLDYINNNPYYTLREEDLDEIIMHFEIPNHHIDDFNKFIQGQYSKFSDDYKMLLVSIYERKSIMNSHRVSLYNTVYPEQFKRELIAKEFNVELKYVPEEVLDIPDMDKELYKPIYKLQQINNSNIKQL